MNLLFAIDRQFDEHMAEIKGWAKSWTQVALRER